MNIQPTIGLDWADDLAASIIAEWCGRGFTEARQSIAGKLRNLRKTCDEAALARIRIAGRGVSDEQFDYEAERRHGWSADA